MTLRDFLTLLEPGRELWTFPEFTVNTQSLIKSVELCRKTVQSDADSRIALEVSDTATALTWMMALDGVAGKVFLVPESLRASDDYIELTKQFNASFTITDTAAIKVEGYSETGKGKINDANIDTQWVLATSGTTGTPKLIEHSTKSLIKTCKFDTQRGKDFRWGLVYDPFRFAGLQVVLQALASGSHLVFVNKLATVSEQIQFMCSKAVNALSATPTYWRKLLMTGEMKGYSLKQITLGGEPADKTVLNALRTAFPGARIAHIYASTEAGVGFSVTDGQAGFPQTFLQHGVGGNCLAVGAQGTLLIKPENHVPTSGGSVLVDSQGYIDTGDLIELCADRVYFLGRDSGAINVGGNKVIPEEVEAVIREIEGVVEVVVKPKRSGVMGQLVTAEVQITKLVTDTKVFRKSIISHCREKLDKFKVPALIRFVEEIDYNPTGKISRL